MSGFHAILLEGVFYLGDEPYPDVNGETREGYTDLLVPHRDGPKSVYDELLPLVGSKVRVAAHHLPMLPIDPARWGGGCCMFQEMGHCPFGHHEHPGRLFNVSEEGILVYDIDHSRSEGGWWVERFDGTRVPLPLAHALVGHQSRVAAATALAIDEMKDAVAESGMDPVEALGGKITEMRDLAERLQGKTRKD